jgi:hypothetical protein
VAECEAAQAYTARGRSHSPGGCQRGRTPSSAHLGLKFEVAVRTAHTTALTHVDIHEEVFLCEHAPDYRLFADHANRACRVTTS